MASGLPTLVLVGNPDPVHVGAHLLSAAQQLNVQVTICDPSQAFAASGLRRRFNWWLRGHRPSHLREFSECVVAACRLQKPRFMLATGIAPVDAAALQEIGRLGVTRLNFLTDDPWNPSHRSQWFMNALPHYDWIFSTRTSNITDIKHRGGSRVAYVPFGYEPAIHHHDPPSSSAEKVQFAADIAFAGGADQDRIPIFTSLIHHGFNVALYGGYWSQYRETKAVARGHADARTVRKVIGGAKVALCLVRRANRDGSSMRTFELAAMGACMLAEYSDEHRQILGDDGDAVVYFRSTDQMISRLRWLLRHDDERRRLSHAVRERIASGRHTYRHRLETMLAAAAS